MQENESELVAHLQKIIDEQSEVISKQGKENLELKALASKWEIRAETTLKAGTERIAQLGGEIE